MYILLNPEDEAVFNKEIDIVIKMEGQTSTATELSHYFDIAVRNRLDMSIVCTAYKGSYVLHKDFLEVTKLECSEDLLITESGELQELVCKKTIQKFINLAKKNFCSSLIIYTKNSIVLETLYQYNFNLTLLKDSKVVRSKLSL